MRILYLTYSNQSGVVQTMTRLFESIGYTVDVLNIATGVSFRYHSLKFPRLSLFNLINTPLAILQFGKNWKTGYTRTDFAFYVMSKKMTEIINRRTDYDIIFQSGVIFGPIGLKVNKPYCLGILDNTYLIGKKGRSRPVGLQLSNKFVAHEERIYHLANQIFVMSRHVKKSLIEDYSVESNKIAITGMCPNVIPKGKFSPNDKKYSSKRILLIGMNFCQKGGFELLKAFTKVREKIEDCQLIVIGDRIKSDIEGVIFKGVVGHQDIANELELANIYVMPSKKEAFGIALIEAMAFSTPCIATNIEAIPEIIQHGVTGFIVEPNNIDELSERMTTLLESPSLSKKMGAQGRKRYASLFSEAQILENLKKSMPVP